MSGTDATPGTVGRRRPGRPDRPAAGAPPEPRSASYYGRPIVRPPNWAALDIAGYFYAGGLAAGCAVLAGGAQLTGRPALARACRLGALGGVALSLVGLVHDLGRPGRFLNMLRVVKPTSPMSMGSWILCAFGPPAGVAAVCELTGRLPRLGRLATGVAALVGPAVATYTAVLLADTAVPAWHEGRRELPLLFAGSATATAAGLGMLAAPVAQASPARAAAVFGAGAELLADARMRRRLGLLAEPYRTGRGGRLTRAGRVLTATGALVGACAGALPGRRGRLVAALGGAALLAGGACTRFGVFAAGVASARDPKYTVLPQRARLAARRRGEEAARDAAGEAGADGAG
ncbi:NrfD/PsrC family molybdoenzyme membrane anchor subunit [Allostreptomyces psammosilenae]|uniref:Polysulfide reductase n=1 Tax=Allostreptomyces psammosilenae TaxID=1892865 RepID=A0A852ZUB6_9ACTN|nr:NrfD/PsrC family molybdoenzyme membrane anchor subunit [Allostreptomyces psammosilenae]NYI04880.1 hypothetical protein [Allostreptomyces psammosilenae]